MEGGREPRRWCQVHTVVRVGMVCLLWGAVRCWVARGCMLQALCGDGEGGQAVCVLGGGRLLTMLCGAGCEIGAQGGVAIGKALETNAALNDLDLCSESGRMARAAMW